MPDTASKPTNSPIVATFRELTPTSAKLAERALEVFPSGIVHDSRRMAPYGLYVERAEGSRKWDADGNEYIDYYGGHGALLLGHAHPDLTAAVAKQVALGTHPAACHRLELEWGRLVKQLVPSAERVRFTSSGTEANLMALRLARAYTGKPKLLRFKRHFHGWQDHVAFAVTDHFDGTPTPGVVDGIAENVIVADPADVAGTQALLEGWDDFAAVIIEPTGASSGQVPLPAELMAMLRRVTEERGIVLIFDEVVTGFRVSKGGAQAYLGVTPDLTALAKILGGGLPAGAVAGRKEIMDLLDFDIAADRGFEKIAHQGTFNANPLSAASGVAMLMRVRDDDVPATANAQGDKLKAAWNQVFSEENVAWAAYGQGSSVYIHTNPDGDDIDPLAFDPAAFDPRFFTAAAGHPAAARLRLALMIKGVDISGKLGAIVSAAHTDDDIAATAEAMRHALHMLKFEGALS